MEKNYQPLLTPQEFETIEKLQLNPDPTARLRSNFYQLRRKQIEDIYNESLRDGIDSKDRLRFQTQKDEALHELRKEYEADVNHAIQLHLATFNCWIPWNRAEVA